MTQKAKSKSSQASPLGELLASFMCPRCENGMALNQDMLQCKKCKTTFRNIDGIPWLLDHGDRLFWEWRQQIDGFLRSLQLEAKEIEDQLQNPSLLDPTRKRLEIVKKAKLELYDHYLRLFAPFHALAVPPPPWQSVPQTKIPLGTKLGSYEPNLFRDWAWGEEENRASLDLIRKALKEDLSGKRLLVLGGGSSRLAYDLHASMKPEMTVVLEHNPLHLLSAKRIIFGEELKVYEFPLSPVNLPSSAVLRTLRAPNPSPPGLHLLFADATQPPFQNGSFDLVLTPWFIDVVPEELPVLLSRVNAALKKGGHWVHFGPLGFRSKKQSQCYGLEEVLAFTEKAGFTVTHHQSETIPYLKCPESGHSRVEVVQVIASEKVDEVSPVPKTSYLPSWLVHSHEPVPMTKELAKAFESARAAMFFISLIDGQRSIDSISKIVAEQTKTSEDVARAAIINLLTYVFESER